MGRPRKVKPRYGHTELSAGIKFSTTMTQQAILEAVERWNKALVGSLFTPTIPPPSPAWLALYNEALIEANARRWVVGL